MTPLINLFLSRRDEFLTIKETAALLGKSDTTMRAWVDAGKVDAVKVGGTLYVHKPSLNRMIRRN
jgi:excisionase family DNA binding protein